MGPRHSQGSTSVFASGLLLAETRVCSHCFFSPFVLLWNDSVRPENSQEVNSNKVVEIIDNQSLVFDPWHMTKDSRGHGSSLTTRRARNIVFGFDRVCLSLSLFL